MFFVVFFKDFIYLFLDRGEGREKERERNIHVWLLSCAPNWDLARNPGMCPDWEWNQRHFALQVRTQSTEPHQPEPQMVFFIILKKNIPIFSWANLFKDTKDTS